MRSITFFLTVAMISAGISGCLENIGIAETNNNDCNSGECIGLECGIPSFSSLDNNSDGALDVYEFVYGMYEYDAQYGLESYADIYDEITHVYSDDDEDDEYDEDDDDNDNDNEMPLINETLYNILGLRDDGGLCLGLDCGIPEFSEMDSNSDGTLSRSEFVEGLMVVDSRWGNEFDEAFDDISHSDGVVDSYEYEDFREEVGYSSDWEEHDDSDINHSEEEIKFSSTRPRCYHVEFFDRSNDRFGGWGGEVRFISADGVTSTIEDFSYGKKYVTLSESTTWTMEYTFDEGDVGFIIDGVTYGGDNNGFAPSMYNCDDDECKYGTIILDFS